MKNVILHGLFQALTNMYNSIKCRHYVNTMLFVFKGHTMYELSMNKPNFIPLSILENLDSILTNLKRIKLIITQN